jgi:hypothetical protein
VWLYSGVKLAEEVTPPRHGGAVVRASGPHMANAPAGCPGSTEPNGGKMPPGLPAGCQRYSASWPDFQGRAAVDARHLYEATPLLG